MSSIETQQQKIDESPLPLLMKLDGIRQIAISKVQHFFANVHISRKVLQDLNNRTVKTVRRWFGMNSHTTRDVIHHSRREGGLGVPDFEWTYFSTRLSHLLCMLNNDDDTVREMARASLFLDLGKRKVPRAREAEQSFLGFRKKANGKLETNAPGFGVRSDWPDLNDLCHWTGVNLQWSGIDATTEEIIKNKNIRVTATVLQDGLRYSLPPNNMRASLLLINHEQRQRHWRGLKLQGKLACVPFADHSISHTIFYNSSLDEDILIFTVKARLQVYPTKLNLSIWYPRSHSPLCIHHGEEQVIESMSHILNGCHFYKGLYVSRHDRVVDIISGDLPSLFPSDVSIYKNCIVKQGMFSRGVEEMSVFSDLNATRPDMLIIDESSMNVHIIEVGCCFDSTLEEAFLTKLVKYQPLVQQITGLGYKCQYLVLIFGSLGHVHRLAIRGLMMVGFTKARAKQIAKYCSISCIIGSRHIWRRRCCVYP